ncbi:MAG: hypothetical protein LBT14_02945 [Treponema sp.]|jgi:hypothetical protein|nr:hypothetical protein [Treponema sp.]
MAGHQRIRTYTKYGQLFTSGNWYTKGRKARFRRVFKKGARQAGKVEISEQLKE